jgi:hypothetical protein
MVKGSAVQTSAKSDALAAIVIALVIEKWLRIEDEAENKDENEQEKEEQTL